MRIGILGAGHVGGTLGRAFAHVGHEIIFGVPNPAKEKYRQLVESIGPKASMASVQEAAEAGEVVEIATPWPATEEAITSVAGALAGKVIIDSTNPLRPDYSGLAVPPDSSAAELIAGWAPEARVVKAFNHVGYQVMANPRYTNGAAMALVAGNDEDARTVVLDLARAIGFDVQDAGGIHAARMMEQLCMLWIYLGFTIGLGPDFAFGLLQR